MNLHELKSGRLTHENIECFDVVGHGIERQVFELESELAERGPVSLTRPERRHDRGPLLTETP
jgi:hypothetical protein